MGQKNNAIVLYKMMQTFDIVLKKIHGPGVNRFDETFSCYGLTITTKVMIQQKYEAITGVNYRADMKRFTLRQCNN